MRKMKYFFMGIMIAVLVIALALEEQSKKTKAADNSFADLFGRAKSANADVYIFSDNKETWSAFGMVSEIGNDYVCITYTRTECFPFSNISHISVNNIAFADKR